MNAACQCSFLTRRLVRNCCAAAAGPFKALASFASQASPPAEMASSDAAAGAAGAGVQQGVVPPGCAPRPLMPFWAAAS